MRVDGGFGSSRHAVHSRGTHGRTRSKLAFYDERARFDGQPVRAAVQPPLFAAAAPHARLRVAHAEAARLAAVLSPQIRFGTAGWAHPEWVGEVFASARPPHQLLVDGLDEYAAHPLLKTVLWEVPELTTDLLRDARLVAAAPAGLSVLAQVPLTFTRPRTRAPTRVNPSFLEGRALERDIVRPLIDSLGPRLAGIWLSFPGELARAGISAAGFASRLEATLAALPRRVPVLVELSEPGMLTLAYARALLAHGATHVLSTAPGMPSLAEQARVTAAGPLVAIRAVGRPQASEIASMVAASAPRGTFVVVDAHVPEGAPELVRRVARLVSLPPS